MPVTGRHVSIVVVDVQQFGARPDLIQTLLRARLHEIIRGTLETIGVDLPAQLVGTVDRGDGAAVLIDPAVPRETLTGPLVERLAEELRRHELQSAPVAGMRWRLSLHSGEVAQDAQGFSGEALNTACRIVDLEILRDVLAGADGMRLVVALSDEWFRSGVRAGWLDGDPYRSEDFRAKELTSTIHVRVPGLRQPPWPDQPAGQAPPVPVPAPAPNSPVSEPDSAAEPARVPLAGRDYVGRDQTKNISVGGNSGDNG